MNHYTEDNEPTTCCDTLLAQANSIYLQIEMHYQSMQNNLSATSSGEIMQTVGFLNALLKEAQEVDYMVADALENVSGFSVSTSTLLEQRGEILSRLYQGNRNIAVRAKNVQSLLRHEITSLSANHTAINGYKPQGAGRNNIICASF